jgi:hypothetical protein
VDKNMSASTTFFIAGAERLMFVYLLQKIERRNFKSPCPSAMSRFSSGRESLLRSLQRQCNSIRMEGNRRLYLVKMKPKQIFNDRVH